MTARSVVVATPWSAPAKLLTLTHALERVDDPPVDEEVDVDRGVVLGDRRLARDLDELLAHVDLDRPVDERDQEPEARLADHRLVGLAQPEHDHPLVLLHDPDRQVQDHEHDDGDERQGRKRGDDLHELSSVRRCVRRRRRRRGAGFGEWLRPGSTMAVSPSKRTRRTRASRSRWRSSVARAVQGSPPSSTVPVGSSGAWTIPGVPGGTGAPIVPDDARIRRPRYTPPAARATSDEDGDELHECLRCQAWSAGRAGAGADGVGAASSGTSSTMAVRPSNPIEPDRRRAVEWPLVGRPRAPRLAAEMDGAERLRAAPGRRPVVPSGTRVPTTPAGAGMRRVRTAASVMKPMRMAVVAVVVTMSGVATCDQGQRRVAARLRVQGGRAQREADDPAHREQPVAHDLRLEREQHEPRPTSSSPATLSGRLPKPMNARMSAIAPRIPVTKFGFWSSKMSPYSADREQDERDVRVGQQVEQRLERVHRRRRSPRRPSARAVCGTPLTVTSGRRPARGPRRTWRRSRRPHRPRPPRSPGRLWASATVETAHSPAGRGLRDRRMFAIASLRTLSPSVPGMSSPPPRHRRRGADVRPGRHEGEVRGERDERPRAGGAAARGRHPHDHRHVRLEERGVIRCVASRLPPGVLSSTTTAAAPSAPPARCPPRGSAASTPSTVPVAVRRTTCGSRAARDATRSQRARTPSSARMRARRIRRERVDWSM